MDRTDLIGTNIYHKTIKKNGVIVNVDNEYVYITFQNENNPSKFVYPDTLVDDEFIEFEESNKFYEFLKQEEIIKDINSKKKKADTQATQSYNQQRYNTKAKDTVVKRFENQNDFYDFYQNQLNGEIKELRYSNVIKKVKVYDGHFIQKQKNIYYYTFESDIELGYPSDTPIKIYTNKQIDGKIEHCEEFTITISSCENLGYNKEDNIESLEFSVESWRLLGALNDRLNELKTNTPKITKELITQGTNNIIDAAMYKGQDKAIEMALYQPITFIWGPPGTGKTQTLARISLSHINLGHKVLMLSYSNVSVDGAIKRTHQLDENKKIGKLIRYGYPKDAELKDHEYLTSFNCACLKNKDILKERQELNQQYKKCRKDSIDALNIQKKIEKLQKKVRDDEIEIVKNASFVATTISKAIIDKEIYNQKFDVVIFDEASMSFIPQVIFSSSLASKYFVCIGDFKQLPPIVQSEEAENLNVDIFQYCGITSAVANNMCHKWLCMLDTQYRMNKEIADFVSRTMYANNLITAENIIEERNNTSNEIGIVLSSYGLADVSNMMTVCCKNSDGSHINVLTAFLSFGIAMNAMKNSKKLDLHNIGIITPYNAQSRLLHCMSMDQKEKSKKDTRISCATVHQFQGSEKEMIIYDAVDCYREKYPGKMITAIKNEYANRLFNVAMTRAMSKFIAVANKEYLIKKSINSRLMFGNLLEATSKIRTIDYKKLEQINVVEDSCIKFYNKVNAVTKFIQDIKNAKKSIVIDIPNSLEDDENLLKILKYALSEAKMNKVSVVVRSDNKKDLPVSIKSFSIQRKYIINPLVVIDKSITWFGMPYSNANFNVDGDIIKTLARPIIRFKGKKTSSSIYSLMEMDKTADESTAIEENENTQSIYEYILQHKKCDKCSSVLQLKKSFKGKFYYQCTKNKEHTAFVDKEDVNNYIYEMKRKCPNCQRTTMEAKLGKYGVFVSCFCGKSYKIDEI